MTSPGAGDPVVDGRAPAKAESSLREDFWRRVLFGRWGIAIGLSLVFALTPSFGPGRGWIALGMAAGSCAQSTVLWRVISRHGSLPRACTVSDHVFVAIAGIIAPATLTWGMIVLAITLPLAVIAYQRGFATRLVAVSTPAFLVICLIRQPDLWPIGLAIFAIGGLGSVSLVGFATEEEQRVRARYGDILDQLQVVVFESPGIGQQLSYVNDHVGNMLGFTRADWLQPSWWESRLHPDDHAVWTDSNDRTIAGQSHQASYRMYAEDGRLVHILEITRVLDVGRGRTKIRGVLVDVTRQAKAEAEASQLGMFVDQIPLALQILEIEDPDDISAIRMVAANRMACDNVEATLEDLKAKWPREYATIDSQPGNLEAFAAVRRTGEALTDYERPWVDRNGADRRVNIEAFALGGNYVGVSYEDITDRANAEAALRHQANHDALTGLPNRVLLAERLDAALRALREEEADRGDDALTGTGALLMMDLNQFKEVNDALGHHHGDRLLVELSSRLREIAGGRHVIARLGGDEFAMIIEGGTTRVAFEVATEIGRRFAEPTVIDGVTLQSNVSVGIALYPEHADDADGLMQRADAAMYRAKKGGTGVSLFTPDQSTAGIRRLQLLSDLRTAVGNDELMLHYQPRVDFGTGQIEGLEALVRWEHPTWGLLPPDEFIGLAEVSGLIQDLTQFVIRAAVADCARLREIGHSLPVAINLSVRNLYSPDLVEGILTSLAAHSLPSELLRVELTESEIMDDPAIAMQVLQRLRSEGVQVSIDDFGTGYSSLSYLRDLPIDEIKIDRSFVADITDGDDVVVRSIIDLGHALGVLVAGEGVETVQQWEHLRRLGCDVAQGYLISRPLAFETLVRFLHDRAEFGTDGLPTSTLGAPVTRG
ncbi:MAG: EAL domain-containing protein [Acidimicrobiales bacterium]